jgi:hypothetical protein
MMPAMRAGALILLVVLGLGGCEQPTPYQPALGDGGYAEQAIEANRYRVAFYGNASTPRESVENALLYRAAELTMAHQKDYFVLVREAIEPRTTYRSYYDDYPPEFSHSPLGWDHTVDSGFAIPITRYDGYAEIVLQSGQKPQDDVHAFDAREVIARLGPTLLRPGQKARY